MGRHADRTEPVGGRKLRKLLALGAAGVVVLVLATTVVALLPPVQRAIVLRIVSATSGVTLEVGHVRVGPFRARLSDVRMTYAGAKVAIAESTASYNVFALLLSRTAYLEKFEANGVTVDVRDFGAAAEEQAESQQPEARFDGLGSLLRMPLRIVARRLTATGEVLLPARVTGAYRRAEFTLDGHGVEPGSTGELELELTVTRQGTEKDSDLFETRGRVEAHQTEDHRFDHIVFRGRLFPTGGALPEGTGYGAELTLDLRQPDERYELSAKVVQGETEHRVIGVLARWDPASRSIAGEWEARLSREVVRPFVVEVPLVDFSFEGKGEFGVNVDEGRSSTNAVFTAVGREWGALHPSLESAGAANLEGSADLTLAGDRLTVRDFDVAIADEQGRRFIEVEDQQALVYDTVQRRWVSERYGEPILALRFDGLPLDWLPDDQGMSVDGGTVEGSLAISLDEPGIARLSSPSPITGRDLRLRTTEVEPNVLHLSFSLSPNARLSREELSLTLQGSRFALARGAVLQFDGSARLPFDGSRIADLDGDLRLVVPLVTRLIPEVHETELSGSFQLDLSRLALLLQRVSFHVDDARGVPLTSGSFVTRRPLALDLTSMRFDLTEFEPVELAWRLDGFPVAWMDPLIPEFTTTSGRLFGGLTLRDWVDGTARIEPSRPLALRGLGVEWQGISIFEGADIELWPTLKLTPDELVLDVDRIRLHSDVGDRLKGRLQFRRFHASPRLYHGTAALELELPRVTGQLGDIGAFRCEYRNTLNVEENALDFEHIDFAFLDGAGREFAHGQNVGPFRVNYHPYGIRSLGDDSRIFEARLRPLPIAEVFRLPFGLEVEGNLPDGGITLSAEAGALVLRTDGTLESRPVTMRWRGAPLLDRVAADVSHEIVYDGKAVEVRDLRLALQGPEREIAALGLTGRYDIDDRTAPDDAHLRLAVDLRSLFEQPFGSGFPGYSEGRFDLSLGMSHSADEGLLTASARLHSLVDRETGDSLPALNVDLEVRRDAERRLQIDLPLTISAEDGVSDLRLTGESTPDGEVPVGGRRVDVELRSERIDLGSVRTLLDRFFPLEDVADDAQADPSDGSPGERARPPRTALAELRQARDKQPFWGSRIEGTASIDLKGIEARGLALENLRAAVAIDDDSLAVERVGAALLGAQLTASLAIDYDATHDVPYSLTAEARLDDLDLGRMFREVAPDRDPTFEGSFEADYRLVGRGRNPWDVLAAATASLDLRGQDGVARLFPPKEASHYGRMISAAGTLTFSKPIRAVGRLVRGISEMEFDTLELEVNRNQVSNLEVESLRLVAEDLRLEARGSARVPGDPGAPLAEAPIELQVGLATRGDMAKVLKALDLLGPGKGTKEFRDLREPVIVEGTLGDPDASRLYEMLDEGIDNARGSFGWAVRKARKKMLADREPE